MKSRRTRKILVALCAAAGVFAVGVIQRPWVSEAGPLPSPSAAADVSAFTGPVPLTVPPAVMRAVANLPDERTLGPGLASQARELAADLGSAHVDIYAFPTARGGACVVVVGTGNPGTCLDRFDRNRTPLAASFFTGAGLPLTIAGLVPDSVQAVDITIGGQSHAATIHGNALFFQTQSGVDLNLPFGGVEELAVHYRDGSTAVKLLPAHR